MRKPTTLPKDVIDGLSPGVRHLVVWLNAHGFETTDSGDGTNAAKGMGCAVDYPMIAIAASGADLVERSAELFYLLMENGVSFSGEHSDRTVEASYSPTNCVALILLIGVDDAAMWG